MGDKSGKSVCVVNYRRIVFNRLFLSHCKYSKLATLRSIHLVNLQPGQISSNVLFFSLLYPYPGLILGLRFLPPLADFPFLISLFLYPPGLPPYFHWHQSALYAYTLTLDVDEDDDDEGGLDPIITSIALHRIISVCIGVLWGMFITSYIWPISARYDIRVGLSELYLHLGWFFRTNKRVGAQSRSRISSNNGQLSHNAQSSHNGQESSSEADALVSSSLSDIRTESNGVDGMNDLERCSGFDYSPLSRIRPFLDKRQEIALQGLLVHLKGLLNAAANEPRLKVPPSIWF